MDNVYFLSFSRCTPPVTRRCKLADYWEDEVLSWGTAEEAKANEPREAAEEETRGER